LPLLISYQKEGLLSFDEVVISIGEVRNVTNQTDVIVKNIKISKDEIGYDIICVLHANDIRMAIFPRKMKEYGWKYLGTEDSDEYHKFDTLKLKYDPKIIIIDKKHSKIVESNRIIWVDETRVVT